MRLLEALLLITALELGVLIGTHEDGPEESSVNGAGVQNDGVLLVVAGVGRDGNDGVDS